MMRSAKPGLSSAKSDIAAGGARLTARMGGQSVLTKFRGLANVRFAPPQADVPEKSAFDLDRAKTSSEGRPAWGPDPGIISGGESPRSSGLIPTVFMTRGKL
jgi:hypothetical protein